MATVEVTLTNRVTSSSGRCHSWMTLDVEKYLPLARKIVSRYHFQEREDLYQVACLGILEARDTLDPARVVNESAFVRLHIRRAIWVHRRTQRRKVWDVSMVRLDDDDVRGHDWLGDGRKVPTHLIDMALVMKLVSELTRDQRRVIELRHGLTGELPMDCAEIAQALGTTKLRVTSMTQTAYEKMRKRV